jgi:dipeptidyl aminopeptidase/acylaminoacyl peptidase
LIGLFVAVAAAAVYWWLQPRVLSVQPEDGADPVPANTSLRVVFSRLMKPDSVTPGFATDPPTRGRFAWEGNTLVFTPDQPWPSGQVIGVSLAPGARSAGLLPLIIRQETRWSFTTGHPRLLYLYPSDEAANLYLLDPQSGEITQLTSSLGAVQDYSTTQDGKIVYFNTSLGNGGSAVYTLDLPAGKTSVLFECPDAQCRYPRISPDGEHLAYERTSLTGNGQAGFPQVWLLPLSDDDGSEPIQPAGDPILAGPADHRTQQPQWSPTGLLTFYDFTSHAFVVQDAQSRQVATFPSQTGIPGTWDSSGERYVFPEIYTNEIANPDLTGLESIPSSRLIEYRLDGSRQDLTQSDGVEDASPIYTPDGAGLVFARKYLDVLRWTPGRQIWEMGVDGSQPEAVTNDPYHNHYDLAWSPDGAWLAYVRFNKDVLTEPPELWMMNAGGSGATRLVTSGFLPQWIP